MSNFDLNNALSVDSNVVSFNYENAIDIFKSDTNKQDVKSSALNYWKIKYNNSTDTNLFFSGINPSSVTATNIYFFGLLHDNVIGLSDPGTKIEGEIVIEHNINNNAKIYTCFFVQPDTSGSSTTSIDKIYTELIIGSKISLSQTENNSVRLSDVITYSSQKKYFHYHDTQNPNNIVILFLTPITVNNKTSKWFKGLYTFDSTTFRSPLFTIQSPLALPGAPAAAGKDNPNNDDNQIYIDCNPSGESDETITTYNLPINSELMGQKTQMDFMKTSVNFFIFIIAVILAYLVIPALYKKIVIDKVSANIRGKRIRSIDIFISMMTALAILICFLKGFSKNDFKFLSTGLFLLVLYGLSFALIYSKKSSDEWEVKDTVFITDINDLFDFVKMCVTFIFTDILKYYFAAVLVSALIIFVIGVYSRNKLSKTLSLIGIVSFMLLPIISIMILLSQK
uniref:Uncharacterized protein n=1 Tax=viral metagenome TaxID=1070528 RepID=A0A6C0JMF9_9ZZZZ